MPAKIRLAVLGIALALTMAHTPVRSEGAVDWSAATAVTVIMTEDRVDPSRLRFRLGVPSRLHLENRGVELHEFTAPAFLTAIEIGNRDVLARDGHEIVLRPKEAKDLYFVTRQAGSCELICADRDAFGMTGEIVVE